MDDHIFRIVHTCMCFSYLCLFDCMLFFSRQIDEHLLESEMLELRERRSFQSFLSRQPCHGDRDCYPAKYMNISIPQQLIKCRNTVCVCKDCFVLLNDTCVDAPCHDYNEHSQDCEDLRRSQKTALLLSVFLSSIGAANFYIGQYGLGKYTCVCLCGYYKTREL